MYEQSLPHIDACVAPLQTFHHRKVFLNTQKKKQLTLMCYFNSRYKYGL